MKLFDGYEAVIFPQEDMILVTHNGFLYYIYKSKHGYWIKHDNAGYDYITVANYPSVDKEVLIRAMKGIFPQKETDFMRLCSPSQLCIRDMLGLLKDDYPDYMSDYSLYHMVHCLLLESDVCHKSFEEIRKLLDKASACREDIHQVCEKIKALSLAIMGRDIFKKEIGIVDGHDGSSYFWIMPVRIIDYTNTIDSDNVAKMRSSEISIEEDDVAQYLTPFLYKYFDEELEANKKRIEGRWTDDEGNEQVEIVNGFEWYLTHNYFTFDSMEKILEDIRDTVAALSEGRENEFTAKLKIKRGTATYQLLYAKNLTKEEVEEYNANRPTEDSTDLDLIIDFYRRFIYRMEYMLRVGEEKGYNLISFMGP